MPGYSATPLIKKLGIKPGLTLYIRNRPVDYENLLGELPDALTYKSRLTKNIDFIHLFTKSRRELTDYLPRFIKALKPEGIIWVSWPKKASRLKTDVTEDVIRELALPLGLIDIKVCAVDDIWSGLKLVIRKENR